MAGRLHFALTSFEYGAGPGTGVDPMPGGTSLRELVSRFESRHGWTPAGGYGPLPLDRLADLRGRAGRVTLLGCVCGDVGCWPLTAALTTTADTVTWSDFAQPHRPEWDYEGFGPFVFSRTEHDTALRDLVDRVGTSPA